MDALVSDLRMALGESLESLVLYGSALKDGGAAPDLLVVLKEVRLSRIEAASKALLRHKARAAFYAARELTASLDVFPVEFQDILGGYRVLAGPDLLAECRVGTENLRHQLEFELRSKLLRLRAAWPGLKGDSKALRESLGRAGSSLAHLLRHARKLAPLPAGLEEPFERARGLKAGATPSLAELQDLYGRVHDALQALVLAVDESR